MPFPKLAGNYRGHVIRKKIDKSTNGFFQFVAALLLHNRYDSQAKKAIDLEPKEEITAYIMLTGNDGPNLTQCQNLADAFKIGPVDKGFLKRLNDVDVSAIEISAKLEVDIDSRTNKPRLAKDGTPMLRVAFINPAGGFKPAPEDVTKFLEGGAGDWMKAKLAPVVKEEKKEQEGL